MFKFNPVFLRQDFLIINIGILRYEKKFKITGVEKSIILQSLVLHPSGLTSLYPERQVNNIYFDSIGFSSYHDNVNGSLFRKKYRVRWYGGNIVKAENPVFEIKIKENELGYKQTNNIDNFSSDQLDELSEKIYEIYPLSRKILKPVLLNSYNRLYFTTADKKFRITLDYNLRYSPLLNGVFTEKFTYNENETCILEVKYDAESDDEAEDFFMLLPYQRTKNSKYVSGIQLCYY